MHNGLSIYQNNVPWDHVSCFTTPCLRNIQSSSSEQNNIITSEVGKI